MISSLVQRAWRDAAPPLSPGWQEKESTSQPGKTYFANADERVSTWDRREAEQHTSCLEQQSRLLKSLLEASVPVLTPHTPHISLPFVSSLPPGMPFSCAGSDLRKIMVFCGPTGDSLRCSCRQLYHEFERWVLSLPMLDVTDLADIATKGCPIHAEASTQMDTARRPANGAARYCREAWPGGRTRIVLFPDCFTTASLLKCFPHLFSPEGEPRKPPYFSCWWGQGWNVPIRRLLLTAEALRRIQSMEGAEQVCPILVGGKEKYAGLRMSWRGHFGHPDCQKLFSYACRVAAEAAKVTCDACGLAGQERCSEKGFFAIRCGLCKTPDMQPEDDSSTPAC